ncbi:hypothetical protein S83_046888, partial [Arachis hypogaea]
DIRRELGINIIDEQKVQLSKGLWHEIDLLAWIKDLGPIDQYCEKLTKQQIL